MALACIILDDVDGGVATECTFDGGEDQTSNAHRAAKALLRYLDTLGKQIHAPVVEFGPATGQNGITQAILLPDGQAHTFGSGH